jgi:hypothetical protein
MARDTKHNTSVKVAASGAGLALIAVSVWLSTEHLAVAEGLFSPLTIASAIVTASAAIALCAGERAVKTGQPVKAVGLFLFFALATAYSLSVGLTRSSTHHDVAVSSVEGENERIRLARESYEAAKATAARECASGFGNRCKAANEALDKARERLPQNLAARAADPAAQRLAALTGLEVATIGLWLPLLLPVALEIGAFILISFGFSPRREAATVATPAPKEKPAAKPKRKAAAKPRPVRRQIKLDP